MSIKYIEVTGKTEDEAIQKALQQLGLERDEVSVEVLARAKTGFLGIGSSPAKIKVSYEVEDEPEREEAPQAQPAQASAPVEAAPVEEPPAPVEKEPVEEAAPVREKPAKKRNHQQKKKAAPVEKPAPAEDAPAAPAAPAQPEVYIVPGADDEVAPRIEQFLTGLMEQLDVEAKPVIQTNGAGIYSVELAGEGLGALIGRRGETLDAIQQLTNYSVNRNLQKRVRIHIDAENYRAKREESLQRLARKTAGKALKYHRNMMLEPMNAYERHVIHAALQDYNPAISTYSTGTEPNRRIVIAFNRSV